LRRIRVLHIITNLPIGGAQDNTLSTLERLDTDRYELSLMCGPEGDWQDRALGIKSLKVIFLEHIVRNIHPIKDIIATVRIYFYLRRGKYDIVHTHSSKPGFYGRIAARLAGTPIVIHTIHGFPFNNFMPWPVRWFFIVLERYLSRLSDRMITVSTLNLKRAIGLRLAPRDRFTNIYSGIDFSKFTKKVNTGKKRRDLQISRDVKVIGLVGRLTHCKGIDYFFQSAEIISSRRDDVLFLVVGDGELRQKCEKWARDAGVDRQTRFLGFRDDIPELLQIIDIYILSSRWEGLGRSLTEALFCSRPTVATSVEGVPELVRNGMTGILVPPADPVALAEGILYLINHPREGKRMGRQAHEMVKKNFCVDAMADRIHQLYQDLLTQKSLSKTKT